MILPTIHRNGTSASALLEQAREAYSAARHLLKALSEAAPHGRDYYPQNGRDYYPQSMEDAFNVAAREHRERVGAVTGVLRDMEKLVEHCCGALLSKSRH